LIFGENKFEVRSKKGKGKRKEPEEGVIHREES
jgi:hypothetical protein